MKKDDFKEILCDTKLILPPLTRYTDYPYRKILARFNPYFISTEMVNARAVIEKNPKTLQMLKIEGGNHFKGSQLVGNDPTEMKQAAVFLEKMGFDYIDINLGCTVKKVVSKGQGIALMKDETLTCEIVDAVSNAVKIPVTVKMRTGYSESRKNAVSLSKKIENVGASAITVHGRSGEKKFGIKLDYNTILKVSNSVLIPVIANGSINSKNAKEVLEKTKASAVMPGRSVIGNPWIIPEIYCTLSDKKYDKPKLKEVKNLVIDHVDNLIQFYGEFSGIRQLRKVLPKYFSSCKHINKLKFDVNSVESKNDVEMLIDRIKNKEGFWMYC